MTLVCLRCQRRRYLLTLAIALDINSGSIFCAACDDLIYHPGLEGTFNSVRMKTGRKGTHMEGAIFC